MQGDYNLDDGSLCARPKEPFEFLQRGKRQSAAIEEGCDRWFFFDRSSWAEAYVSNRISLALYLHLFPEGPGDVAAYPNWRDCMAVLVFENHPESVGPSLGGNDKPMLVHTVQLGDFPETKLTSFVRLYRIEGKASEAGPFFLYRSIGIGDCFYAVPRFAYGHRHLFIPGETDEYVIEGRSNVVDGIANDQGQTWREIGIFEHPRSLLSGINILLYDNLCRIRIQDGCQFAEQLHDVALGPLNL